jgi:hypothetical protein
MMSWIVVADLRDPYAEMEAAQKELERAEHVAALEHMHGEHEIMEIQERIDAADERVQQAQARYEEAVNAHETELSLEGLPITQSMGIAEKAGAVKEMVRSLLRAGVSETNELFQEAWADYESGNLDSAIQRFHDLMHREGIQEDTAQAMALHRTLGHRKPMKGSGWVVKAVNIDTVYAYLQELEAHGINEYTEGYTNDILRADEAFQDRDYDAAVEILRSVMKRAGIHDDIQEELT